MWRGHPYADIDAHGFLDGEITRLKELRLAALETRIDADLRAGRHREVIAELDAFTVEHPFRENLRAMQMLALYRSGRQAEALRAFGHTRTVLVEELGIDPSPELKDLQRRILEQDRTLLAVAGPTVRRGRSSSPTSKTAAGEIRPNARCVRRASRSWHRRPTNRRRQAGAEGHRRLRHLHRPIHAVQAARQVVNERTRVAVDFGDLEIARASRSVRRSPEPPASSPSPIPVRSCCRRRSSSAHQPALGRLGCGVLGALRHRRSRPGMHIFQLVGRGFTDFPALLLDRLPPAVPGAVERSVPGYELRSISASASSVRSIAPISRRWDEKSRSHLRARDGRPSPVRAPLRDRRQRATRVEHPGVVPLLDYWRSPTAACGEPADDRRHLGQRIPEAAWPLRRARPSSRRLPPPSPRPTATGSFTAVSGRTTCCSTTKTTPSSPTSGSTRSAPA